MTKYIAYPWPEYQEYMGEEWFREECYYCADKDIYFIPVNRVNESENKEIRKNIISNLKRYVNCIKDGYDASSAKDFVVKEIEKQIAWLEKQVNKDNQIKLPTFTFDDILALQYCMETVKKVQNDKDLYEKLNDLHGRVYDAYHLEKQGEPNPYSGVSFKYNGHTWGMCARDNGVDILLDKQLFKHLDTQNKQKPIFNADDWYVSKVDGKIHNFKFVENRNEQKSID